MADAATLLPDDLISPSLPVSNAAVLNAALSRLSEEKALAALVVQERAALWEGWTPAVEGRAGMGARAILQEHTSLLDAVVRRLLTLSRERANGKGNSASSTTAGIAVLATGGYGQRLLAPHSDIDITLLAERDEDSPVLRALFGLVMDVLLSGAKIKVGYAYRTLSEAAGDTLDHQTQTALLDARLIAGDASLFARFDTLFHRNLHAADFLFRKRAEREKVRERTGASPYTVEPNVKEGVGGIRDIQTAYWMAHVRFGRSGEPLWRDLVRRKVMTPGDLKSLTESREILLSTRCALHLSAGERREAMTAPRQEAVAARLGYKDDAEGPGVERFMRHYYQAAAESYRIAEKVMARCFDAPLPVSNGSGLSSIRGRIAITDPSRLEGDPLWPLEALEFCQAHGVKLALATEEAMQRYASEDSNSPEGSPAHSEETLRRAGERFVTLLGRPGDACETLRRMQRTGLLRALLPELDACMRLIPYDPSHAFTVGEHTLGVLANLLYLRDTADDSDPNLGGYRAVLKQLENLTPLFLAALLHDIGKQWPVSPSGERQAHEIVGADQVPAICARLGCSREVTEQVEFLVRHHLLLAETSRLRDLAQPATVREVARIVGDAERMRMLYLLTYADTRAVGPGVWTAMTARLLDELFERTEAMFASLAEGDDLPAPDARADGEEAARLDTVRQRLGRQLTARSHQRHREARRILDPAADEALRAAIAEHVQAMPAAYLLNTPLETVLRHLDLIAEWRDLSRGGTGAANPVVLDMRVSGGGDGALTELTLVTRDDPAPGLLSKVTGALFSCDINLHSAQVFSRPLTEEVSKEGEVGRIVIDTLTVDHRGRPLSVEKRAAAEEAIRVTLGEQQTVQELLTGRRKSVPDGHAVRAFHIDDAASPDYTLVDIEAEDVPGLVYFLASLFTGLTWNIHAARISTWGGSVRCAFYLTDSEGSRLPEAAALDRLWRALAAVR